jgi:hypothetical protein
MFAKCANNRFAFFVLTLLLICSFVLTACNQAASDSTTKPPPTVTINVVPGMEVSEGDEVAMVLETDPYEPLDWVWTVSGNSAGTLNVPSGENIVYTAGKEGVDIIEAKATLEDGTPIKKTITITVTASEPPPPPSETPVAPTEIPPTETPLPPKVTLVDLQDGQKVNCLNLLSGTYSPDVETEYIWPVVLVAGRFYPQDNAGKAAQMVDGEWSQAVRFGNCDNPNPNDIGLTFELFIVTTNDSANAEFEAYIANAIKTGNWEGMLTLPSGTEKQVHIKVIRK